MEVRKLPKEVDDFLRISTYLGNSRLIEKKGYNNLQQLLHSAMGDVKNFYEIASKKNLARKAPKELLSYVWNTITSEFAHTKITNPNKKVRHLSIDLLITPKVLVIANKDKRHYNSINKDKYEEKMSPGPVCIYSDLVHVDDNTGTLYYGINRDSKFKGYYAGINKDRKFKEY